MSGAKGETSPSGWAAASLGDIVEPRSGKANPASTPQAKFIGMEHVEAHTMRLLGTIPAGSMKSAGNNFQRLDVLYGRLRSYLNKVYQPDFEGLCSGEFIVFPESCAVLGRFLKYRLNAADFVRFASRINTGDRPRVDFDQIRVFKLLLPPKPEQDRIADALDELLSDLDAGVAALERVRKKLGHYRAAVLKVAVEGALTAEWRKQHPDTEPASVLLDRILTERRSRWEEEQLRKFKEKPQEPPKNWKARYKEPLAPDTTNLPPLPMGWCWVSLDQLLESIEAGKSFNCQGRPADSNEWGVIKVSAMTWGRFDESQNKAIPVGKTFNPRYEIHVGDLLLSRANTAELVGATVLVPHCRRQLLLSDKSMRLRYASAVNGQWLQTLLASRLVRDQFSSVATGTSDSMRNISQDKVLGIILPLVPRTEQGALVEAIEGQLSVIDHLEADIAAKLESVEALRQSILRHAFTGQLVPQDPNDEPASELLRRIAAERAERAREAVATKPARKRAVQAT